MQWSISRHLSKRMNPTDAKINRFGHNNVHNFSVMENTQQMITSTIMDNLLAESNNTDSSELSRFSRPLLTTAAVLTILIMVISIFGNLLTIIALLKCPKVRNVAAAFIISLCAADFLFSVIVLPFNAWRFIVGTWTHGDFLCKLIPFIQYGNIGVSLLCIAMITINRYVMITHHSLYAKIYKKHWIAFMILFCWLFSYGMQLPTLLNVWGMFGYDTKLGTCSILKDKYGRSSKTFLYIIAFVIPCVIIVICYTRIFWVVHKSEMRMKRHASMQNSIPNNLRGPSTSSQGAATGMGESNVSITSGGQTTNNSGPNNIQKATRIKDQRDIKAKRNEWRITKMVLAIFLSFVACYLPITVIKVADPEVSLPGFHIFGYIMLYLSSCINPIIYVIMNKQYRQAYKTILLCRGPGLLHYTGAGLSYLNSEKWKDTGYSYNHSRTQVSQVSIADPSPSTRTTLSPRTDSPHPSRLPVILDDEKEES